MATHSDTDTYVLVGHTVATLYYGTAAPQKVFAEVALPAQAYARYAARPRPMDIYDRQGRPANFDGPDAGAHFTL